MGQESVIPSVRELIAEYAAVEDRLRGAEADVVGGTAPPTNSEMARLAERERQILSMLRHHHRSDHGDPNHEAR